MHNYRVYYNYSPLILRSPQKVRMGWNVQLLHCVGGQSAIAQIFVHGKFTHGILCGRWYAIENVWECVSQLLKTLLQHTPYR